MFMSANAVYLANTRTLLSPTRARGQYEEKVFGFSDCSDSRPLLTLSGKSLAKLAELFGACFYARTLIPSFSDPADDGVVEAIRGVLPLVEEVVNYHSDGIVKLEVEECAPSQLKIRIYQGDPGKEWFYTVSYCGGYTVEWDGLEDAPIFENGQDFCN